MKTTKVTKNTNDTVAYPYGNAPQVDTVFNNVDYEMLGQKISSIFNDVNKTRAVVAIYKNQIIAEKYAEGFDKDSKILGWSMTKSVLSTVYGIMQHLGKINVKDKAPVAAWQNDDRKEITVHNLLQMNSGLEWDRNYEEDLRSYSKCFSGRRCDKDTNSKASLYPSQIQHGITPRVLLTYYRNS